MISLSEQSRRNNGVQKQFVSSPFEPREEIATVTAAPRHAGRLRFETSDGASLSTPVSVDVNVKERALCSAARFVVPD